MTNKSGFSDQFAAAAVGQSILGQAPSSLSDLSVRSEDCKKLRIKISVSEENSELFDEETEIFRPIYCNRTTAWMQELEQRRSSCRVGQS